MTSLSNIVVLRHDCLPFKILDTIIYLYSEPMEYGRSTVAEINDQFVYLGNEMDNVGSAIFAWEYINGRDLNQVELRQVLTDNNVL